MSLYVNTLSNFEDMYPNLNGQDSHAPTKESSQTYERTHETRSLSNYANMDR